MAIKASPDGIAMCYVGDDMEYIFGIPLRDLTVEEWELLTDRLQDAAVKSGLYVPYAPTEKAKDKES